MKLLLEVGLFVVLSAVILVSANPKILAAVITCVPATPCDGTDGNDTLNGSDQNDQINGLNGKDRIFGNAGDDRMKGGNGSDTINGGDGRDFIDELRDTSKNTISGGGDGDSVNGGHLDDTINGDDGSDELRGYGGNDRIRGGIGSDILQGLDGNDILEGGEGDDRMTGDWDTGPISLYGADTIKGGPGNDVLFQSSNAVEPQPGHILATAPDGKKDVLDCGDGNDEAFGNVNTDHDEFRNCETIHHE